jgi:DNA-binding SARP family transcriptional activator
VTRENDPVARSDRVLECRLLGPPLLIVDGREVGGPFKKILGLTAFLALEGPTPRSRLAGLLWSDLDEASARRNLRRELHRLKTKAPELDGRFEAEGEVLRLAAPFSSDAHTFEVALERDDPEAALRAYRGPLLSGLELPGAEGFHEWLELERERYARLHRQATLRQAERLERRGDLRGALELHLALLKDDDLQERQHREVMRLRSLLGEREAALEQFERFKSVLEMELGLEPLPETLELASRIRTARGLEIAPSMKASSPTLLLPRRAPLVGRSDAWARMETAWETGQIVLLSGEPGIGKTRLLFEFAATKGRFEQNTGRPGDALAPFSTITRSVGAMLEANPNAALPAWVRRELSRLVPALSDDPPSPIASPEERARFFNAFAEFVVTVLRDVPTLVSDDLQFFDAASLEIGLYASQRYAGQAENKHVLAAFRRGELSPETERAVEGFVSGGLAALVELEPLREDDVLDLVRGLSGSHGARLFTRRLHRATGGNPFFALETIRTLFEADLLQLASDGGWMTPFDNDTIDYAELPIPLSVREAVLRRVKTLGAAPQRLLEAACLSSDGFDLETLLGATALTEWEGLEALERAVSARVLEPFGAGHRFAHDLMRSSLAENLSSDRRRLLHRKLAASLEKSSGEPARIADHLERAGLPREAVPWRVVAAEVAGRVFAHREALEQYAKALEDGADDREAFAIRSARTELWGLIADAARWQTEVEHLSELARRLNDAVLTNDLRIIEVKLLRQTAPEDQALARLEALLARDDLTASQQSEAHYLAGAALFHLGRSTETEAHLNRALELLSAEPSKQHGQIYSMLGQSARDRGDYATAMAQHGRAMSIYTSIGHRVGLVAQTINHSYALALSGDIRAAILGFERALTESREIGLIRFEASALLNLGHYLTKLARFPEASAYLEQGLDLARASQNRSVEGTLLLNLAELRRLSGQLGAALELMQSAVRVVVELRHARNHAIYTRDLADVQIELGDLDGARANLETARQVIEAGGLTRLVDDLELISARLELSANQPEHVLDWVHRLESEARESRGDASVSWVKGAALLAMGQPHAAFEAVSAQVDDTDAERWSQIIALRLEATARLGGDLGALSGEAEVLLESGRVPPLEALELRRALAHAFEADHQAERALEVRQIARASLLEMSATLEGQPALEASFLEKNGDLLQSQYATPSSTQD